MAIDATVGGTAANSYVTMAECDLYLENNPYGSAWDSSDEKLIYAQVMLDSMTAWSGTKTTTTQRLDWPREISGAENDEIPLDIKNAQCEIALYLVNNPTEYLPDDDLSEMVIGPIEMVFNRNEKGDQVLLPQIVQGMISGWGSAKTSGLNVASFGVAIRQ